MKAIILCILTFWTILQAGQAGQAEPSPEKESIKCSFSACCCDTVCEKARCDCHLNGTSCNTLQKKSSIKLVAKFGPAECPWSEQLKQEVWNSLVFQTYLEEAGIKKEEAPVQETDETVPVLVLLSPSGEEIGRLGYLLITPEKYIDLMKEMISIYTLCDSLSTLNSKQLLQLYRKSQVLHMTNCEEKLLQEGLSKDSDVEFLIEHYAKLSKDHPRKAHKVKQEIRSRKPHDPSTEWEIALISFQTRRDQKQDISAITLPLEKFLRKFGAEHPEYQWRCHLVLAEFYRDKNMLEKAKKHAQQAVQGAPNELKEMISMVGEEV